MKQLVILSPAPSSGNGMAPLGSRREVLEQLAPYNTAPDKVEGELLYGPGIRIEMPPGEPVTQLLLSVVEEEIAWQVIMRIGRALHWRLLDPESGRELNL